MTADLRTRLGDGLQAAMKSRDRVAIGVLRSTLGAIADAGRRVILRALHDRFGRRTPEPGTPPILRALTY